MTVEGHPIVRRGSLDHYVREVDEAALPHPVVSRFARGENVDPVELYAAAEEAARGVAHSEASLVALAAVRRRLLEAFPGVVDEEFGSRSDRPR